ncbi:two pore calcium channel protein 1 isoform X1 [Patella vulgata]|uniref:two pore calcium channel protein 1 isoform X1 n=1 Tax=Patella vulgata TaxID=6465 RepID=UPI0024A94963|nr:two pore calcium channel protein 1 isoform X1 [Patella vulgata]XP_055957375.1 two pore calcium channel protein 1 isoform X2 [Patella vulgata]XP_055957376.1 two pore calcium channel protein 1 isoform X1 [Patella vulgata]
MTTAKKEVQFINIAETEGGESSTDGEKEETGKSNENGDLKTQEIIEKTEAKILLAATLVLDAKRGRNINFKTEEKFVRSYLFYHSWYLRWGLYAFIILDLSLAFIEKPAVSFEAPYWATILLEIVCLVFFVSRFCHAAYVEQSSSFWKDTKHLIVLSTIILTVLDIICYIIWNQVAPDTNPVRWSRPLRPLFIINFSDGKQVRRAFRNIRRTVPEIMNVLILFFLSVLLFALLALKLFSKRNSLEYPNGDPYFKNYWDCIWDLYVLVTTANNPDVMMPAYDYSNWFALFFIAYVIVCLYIFMSIVLAAIYNNYKKNLKNEIRTSVYSKRRKLNRAFEILKDKVGSQYVITQETWNRLMKKILPTKSQQQLDLLLRILDSDGENVLKKTQFINLSDLLHVELSEVTDRQTFLEHKIPSIYNHKVSKAIRWVVRTRGFRWSFDFLIFVNAFFIAFDLDDADMFFLIFFSLEILLKLYTYGPKGFIARFWNVFDVLVIGSAVLASIIEVSIGTSSEEFRTLDVLLVLRVMRLIKLFGSIQSFRNQNARFKVIIMTIVNIGPSILTYGGVIFVFYYFYAIIGMEVFGNKIHFYGYNGTDLDPLKKHCGNPKLENSDFYNSHYCNNNFNNILKAFVVLFELTVVNQWHVLSSGFVIVTHKAARFYFFCFHLTCVVIVLNIFTAFILEAFILEYSLQKQPRLESVVEAKIKELGLGIGLKPVTPVKPKNDTIELVENEEEPAGSSNEPEDDSDTESIPDLSQEQGLRFHLKKRSRKKVEVLLHQMFEGEIDAEDEGPENEDHEPRKRRLTLETV